MGGCLAELGDYEAAKKYYLEAVTVDYKNADYFLNLAVLEQKMNDNKSALRYLYVAHSLQPENAEITEKLAESYIKEKHYKQAMKLYIKQAEETKETAFKQAIFDKIEETEKLYKNSANPIKYFIWKLFKI